MKKYTVLIVYILVSLIALSYIYLEVEDRANGFIVGYSVEKKDELFDNLNEDEINNLVRDISDNLVKRKSATKKNQEMAIDKFKKRGLIDSKEEENFIRRNLIIEIN